MKRTLTILILVLIQTFFSQGISKKWDSERFSDISLGKFYFSYWTNPVHFNENFILNYKIRYDLLVFEKVRYDTFLSRIKVILEISNNELSTVSRNIQEVKIKCSDYEQTVSKDLYYTGVFKLNLPLRELRGRISIIDEKSQKEILARNFTFNLKAEDQNFVPIFIKSDNIQKFLSDEIQSEFYNFLPFETNTYYLVLPLSPKFESIVIKDEQIKYELKREEKFGLNYSIFILDTLELIEGKYFIELNTSNVKKDFFVIWLNKPEYLWNLEKASKILNYIFPGDELHLLNNSSRKSHLREFYKLWKKFDPTPKTAFNELMFEYYKRADFANMEFRSVSQPDGALTDRGKIYIIYGPPQKIERTFTQDGRALETWYFYSPINKTLKFFDVNKNGNYILQQ